MQNLSFNGKPQATACWIRRRLWLAVKQLACGSDALRSINTEEELLHETAKPCESSYPRGPCCSRI